jgi:DNA-binding transcriptional LysR family regulator
VRDRWTGLELRYLITLAAVGREASFSRAAEALGYTQSAVSQQISRLEHITGARLVERPGGPRPVSLTAAGRLLAGHAEAIGARLASAAADLDALAGGTAGVLRVGCYQSVGARLLPPVMRDFTAAWPQVDVQLSETQDDGDLLADLEGGRLDLTFVVFPLTPLTATSALAGQARRRRRCRCAPSAPCDGRARGARHRSAGSRP